MSAARPSGSCLTSRECDAPRNARRREQRPPVASDHRVDQQPELIDEPGVDQARGRPPAADEVDVLALLALERGDVRDVAQEARVRPRGGAQGVRQHVMRGLSREVRPHDLGGRRRLSRHRKRLCRLVADCRPVGFVAGIHAGAEDAGVDLRHDVVVVRPGADPIRVAVGVGGLSVERNLHSGDQFSHLNLLRSAHVVGGRSPSARAAHGQAPSARTSGPFRRTAKPRARPNRAKATRRRRQNRSGAP